jgi:hypothetical protein
LCFWSLLLIISIKVMPSMILLNHMNKLSFSKGLVLLTTALFLVGGFFVAAPLAHAATTWNVYPSGSGHTVACVLSVDQNCPTIQAAIGVATSGDIVNVVAGNYVENVSISGKTNLTIQGAGISTVIEPVAGTRSVGITITNSNDITIKNLKIHTTGPESHGIWVYGAALGGGAMTGLIVQDTTINVDGLASGIIGDSSAAGVHSGWLIGGVEHGNTIVIDNAANDGGDGIDFQDVTASEVSYNNITISHPGQSTNVLWSSERYDLANLKFNNNTVSGSGGSEVSIITDYNQNPDPHTVPVESPVFNSKIVGVTFSGNTFSNWGSRAIRVGKAYGTGEVTAIVINSNTFQMTANTAEVIGGTATDKTGTGNTFNVSLPAKIQAAVNAASDPESGSGDTINVAAGTYTGAITIDRALTLKGVQDGVAGANSSGVQRSGDTSTITSQLNINSNNVTVDGFDFTNAGTQMNISASGAIFHEVKIKNNVFSGYGSVGMTTYSAGNLLISGNFFKSPLDSTEAMQIKADAAAPGGGCNGTVVSDNVFTAATNNDAADINFSCTGSNSTGVTVSGNTDTGLAGAGGPSFTAFSGVTGGISITNNHVTGTATAGSAIYFFGDVNGSVLIDGNTITGGGYSAVGIDGAHYIPADVANTGTFTITNNTLTGNASGISVATGALGVGGNVVAHNNNLSGNSGFGASTNSTTNTFNATNNWWGDASGPGVVGPGTGDKVSLNVTFDPWCVNNTCTTPPTPPGNSGGGTSGGGRATPAVPANVTTPDGCAPGDKFSTTTGRNCNAATPAVPGGQVLGAAAFHFSLFMKNGSKGNEIVELQKFLTALGYTLTADGEFGPKTKGAVIKFQLANGLKGDGVVGPLTRAFLNKSS